LGARESTKDEPAVPLDRQGGQQVSGRCNGNRCVADVTNWVGWGKGGGGETAVVEGALQEEKVKTFVNLW